MTAYRNKLTIIVILLLLAHLPSKAQIFETRHKVDTLSLSQRISLHTNATDWLLAIPNVGGEFDVIGRNWGRYAIGVDIRGRWTPKHTFLPNNVYNLTGIRLYFRNYYRPRQLAIYDNKGDKVVDGVPRSTGILNRLFSCRRKTIKHPKRTYYRGLYLDYSDFSFKFGSKGKQGKAVTCGFTYGWLTPLYTFHSGHTLDFDLGISAGACLANVTEYTRDRDDNCYRQSSAAEKKILPMLTEIRAGFVYRINKYSITKRYRWRYDADGKYQERMDSINDTRKRIAYQEHNWDSITNKIISRYEAVYDSVAKANAIIREKQQAQIKATEAQKTKELKAAQKEANATRQAARKKNKKENALKDKDKEEEK